MHVETLLTTALEAEFTSSRVCTVTPADLETIPSTLKVVGIGGTTDRLRFSEPRADVDVYMPSRADARTLAMDVERFLLEDLPGMTFAGVTVLKVTSIQTPTWVPYDNPNLNRFVLTIGLRVHDRS